MEKATTLYKHSLRIYSNSHACIILSVVHLYDNCRLSMLFTPYLNNLRKMVPSINSSNVYQGSISQSQYQGHSEGGPGVPVTPPFVSLFKTNNLQYSWLRPLIYIDVKAISCPSIQNNQIIKKMQNFIVLFSHISWQ